MWFQHKRRVYFDYASSTPVLPEVSRVVEKESALFGNPGSIHQEGVVALRGLDNARDMIASQLGCKAREIIFTSGLSEGNNLAILGYARALEMHPERMHKHGLHPTLSGTHWIVSAIEHASILACFADIERRGGEVTFVDPDEHGLIRPESITKALRAQTVFVSVGWGNNEIGVVQQLSAIARAIRDHEAAHKTSIIFHTDGGQAPLYISPQVHTLGVDMMTLGAGKLYGPKGIGLLYLNNRVELAPIILGGGQERGLRAGTEKVALAAGFAKAMQLIADERAVESRRLAELRDIFARRIQQAIPPVILNALPAQASDRKYFLPHMLNISIPDINAEYLVLSLDQAGFALSTKSTCEEGESKSHVVEALERAGNAAPFETSAKKGRAQNTLRFSLGRDTTLRDIDELVAILPSLLQRGL